MGGMRQGVEKKVNAFLVPSGGVNWQQRGGNETVAVSVSNAIPSYCQLGYRGPAIPPPTHPTWSASCCVLKEGRESFKHF